LITTIELVWRNQVSHRLWRGVLHRDNVRL
jgi:hypothetical protein